MSTTEIQPAAQRKALPALTDREMQILRLVVTGLNSEDIGRKLWVSEGTIKSHIHRICQKWGASNRVHAVALAYQHGVLPTNSPSFAHSTPVGGDE